MITWALMMDIESETEFDTIIEFDATLVFDTSRFFVQHQHKKYGDTGRWRGKARSIRCIEISIRYIEISIDTCRKV